jgi:hypothetical protein
MIDHPPPKWRKAAASASNGSCVEVADLGDNIGVRDSKLGDASPILTFTPSEWDAFLAGARAGEFDLA